MDQDDLLIATVISKDQEKDENHWELAKGNSLSSLYEYDETWGAEDEAGEVWGDCWQ